MKFFVFFFSKISFYSVPIVARSRSEGELGSAAAAKRPKSKPLFFLLCKFLVLVNVYCTVLSFGKGYTRVSLWWINDIIFLLFILFMLVLVGVLRFVMWVPWFLIIGL